MRLTILARLLISYLILFTMLAGVSFYFIYHLSQFNRVTRSIILDDTEVLEFSNKLSDAILSETRYERKYIVLKDEKLFESYTKSKADFSHVLDKAMLSATAPEIKNVLHKIYMQHQQFGRLVSEEKALLKTAKPYSKDWFEEEKKKVANELLDNIKTIQQTSERNVFTKIKNLSETGDKARYVSIVITAIALVTGLIVAIIITRSITKPLDAMKEKTKEISQGNFKGDLEISSPPVVSELANAINTMCHKLQEVDNIKTDFFSHMSHELRTPLTSIKEGTNMLLDGLGGEISEKQKRILSIITQESNRMIELVNSLLDLSKMEAGMLSYHFTPSNLADLINRSLQELAPLAEVKSISFENDIDFLPTIDVDPDRIMQVFRNIIGNAIKFTPENGHIRLEGEVKKSFIEIAVHDSGGGIPKEDLNRIFFKFQQIIPAKGKKIKGTGLGLATVKQIILAHGGKVWATSQEGQGSTFYISLPLSS